MLSQKLFIVKQKCKRLFFKEFKIYTYQKNCNGCNSNHYSYDMFVDTFERYIPDELEKIKKMAEAEDPWEFQQETDFNGFK